jgi:hypothetical protein
MAPKRFKSLAPLRTKRQLIATGQRRAPIASSLAANSNDPAFGSVRVKFRGRTADGVLIEERSLTFSPARQSECPASAET